MTSTAATTHLPLENMDSFPGERQNGTNIAERRCKTPSPSTSPAPRDPPTQYENVSMAQNNRLTHFPHNERGDTKKELCHVCSRIVQEFTGGKASDTVVFLGALKKVLSRQSCPLCTVIIHLLLLSDLSGVDPDEAVVLNPRYGEETFALFCGDALQSTVRGFVRVVPILVSSTLSQRVDAAGLLSDQISASDRINPSQVRTWLEWCCREHVSTCRSQVHFSSRRLDGLLLIDSVESKLVRGAPDSEFVALSYVWGDWGGKTPTTPTAQDIVQFERDGYLPLSKFTLPSIVRDAMLLVRQLNKRYLWCDYYCILQGNHAQKQMQISQMDLIYTRALLTIIALTGEHGNMGLPGIQARTRDPICELEHHEDVSFIGRAPGLDILRNSAIYERRGWTFQERLMSPRCLYITNRGAFFQCAAQTFREDDDLLCQTGPDFSMRDLLYSSPRTMWDLMSTESGLKVYDLLLQEYTSRSFTYESDILHAFEGISRILERRLGTFKLGLPSRHLNQALLWRPTKVTTRRFEIASLYQPRAIKSDMFTIEIPPSWSWASWTGQIEQMWSEANSLSDSKTMSPSSQDGEMFIRTEDGIFVNTGSRVPRFSSKMERNISHFAFDFMRQESIAFGIMREKFHTMSSEGTQPVSLHHNFVSAATMTGESHVRNPGYNEYFADPAVALFSVFEDIYEPPFDTCSEMLKDICKAFQDTLPDNPARAFFGMLHTIRKNFPADSMGVSARILKGGYGFHLSSPALIHLSIIRIVRNLSSIPGFAALSDSLKESFTLDRTSRHIIMIEEYKDVSRTLLLILDLLRQTFPENYLEHSLSIFAQIFNSPLPSTSVELLFQVLSSIYEPSRFTSSDEVLPGILQALSDICPANCRMMSTSVNNIRRFRALIDLRGHPLWDKFLKQEIWRFVLDLCPHLWPFPRPSAAVIQRVSSVVDCHLPSPRKNVIYFWADSITFQNFHVDRGQLFAFSNSKSTAMTTRSGTYACNIQSMDFSMEGWPVKSEGDGEPATMVFKRGGEGAQDPCGVLFDHESRFRMLDNASDCRFILLGEKLVNGDVVYEVMLVCSHHNGFYERVAVGILKRRNLLRKREYTVDRVGENRNLWEQVYIRLI